MESICQSPDVLEIQWPFPIEYLRNSRLPSKGPYQVLLFETILFHKKLQDLALVQLNR